MTLETVQKRGELLLRALILRLLPQVLQFGDLGERTGLVGVMRLI